MTNAKAPARTSSRTPKPTMKTNTIDISDDDFDEFVLEPKSTKKACSESAGIIGKIVPFGDDGEEKRNDDDDIDDPTKEEDEEARRRRIQRTNKRNRRPSMARRGDDVPGESPGVGHHRSNDRDGRVFSTSVRDGEDDD